MRTVQCSTTSPFAKAPFQSAFTALRTKRPEWAASAGPGTRMAPRRGRSFRQGHRLEQAAQGGPVGHLGALAMAPRGGPAVLSRHSVVERLRIAFSMKIFLETAPVEAANSAS